MVSPQEGSGGISAFVGALRRDPLRAGFIRHIGFLSAFPFHEPPKYLFSGELTGQFWISLEEALCLVTHPKSIAILEHDGFVPWSRSNFPNRFIDIISNVFETSRIKIFHSRLHSDRLSRLCQTWPSLNTLRAVLAPAKFPPDALPQLCHLEADTRTICRVVPGRPIETLYHVGTDFCWERENDFKLLASAVRGCETLQRIRVNCLASSEAHARTLAAFAHGALQFFHLRISFTDNAIGYGYHDGRWSFRLTPSLVMQVLPSGALALFPKLEVLQIILWDNEFATAVDEPNYGDRNRVENALMAFLISEGHATLHQVDVDCSFNCEGGGAIRFRAARHDGRWHVKTVIHNGYEDSIIARFEDVVALDTDDRHVVHWHG